METTQEQLFDGKTLEEKLQSLAPLYAVIYINPDRTISGLVEHSFSMDWDSNRVNIFWSGKAYSILGEHNLDGKANANYNCRRKNAFIVDLLADDCPIEIDWTSWLTATYKFFKRNAPFKMREGFDFTDLAELAVIEKRYDDKHQEIMKLVTPRNKAEEIYNEKMREAKKEFEAATKHLEKDFSELRKTYQSKAKRIAIERGRCPKLADGRYMNTGNARVTEDGLQLKWFSGGPIVYTVPWKDLF